MGNIYGWITTRWNCIARLFPSMLDLSWHAKKNFSLMLRRIVKHLIDTEWVARVIEVLDRRSDNRMSELGMLSQAFEFIKINQVPADYLEFGLWRGKTFGYAHRMKHRYGRHDMKLWGFDSFQ